MLQMLEHLKPTDLLEDLENNNTFVGVCFKKVHSSIGPYRAGPFAPFDCYEMLLLDDIWSQFAANILRRNYERSILDISHIDALIVDALILTLMAYLKQEILAQAQGIDYQYVDTSPWGAVHSE